jgi:hypothetical protein
LVSNVLTLSIARVLHVNTEDIPAILGCAAPVNHLDDPIGTSRTNNDVKRLNVQVKNVLAVNIVKNLFDTGNNGFL